MRQTGTVRSLSISCAILIAIMLAAASCTTTAVGTGERTSATEVANSSGSTDASDSGDTDSDTDSTDQSADSSRSGDADESDGADPSSARDLQTAPGFRLGGAEQLDALSNDCIDGNDLACDILFQVSGFDSDEEETAVTCGGRSEIEVTFCTDGIDVDGAELVFAENSEGLAGIITACRDAGDMTACDFLFFRSPLGSDTEIIGATCGERVEVAIPDCRTFLSEAE